ncbi:LacI family DNA-binding transcriptional regulator [Streptomyces sp. NPDC102381]|uniref:LacI family DNA-binding transcriptional regulator n=1 Tax=Streptomyces sp. NPDC102381 TaxID=3366164 RepID=UPI0038032539
MAVRSEDVARRAGVSRATVSQILNGRDARFSDRTREKVRDAARELGYEPSVAGRALARGSSDVVIALIPNTTFGGNLQDVFERLTDVLAAQGLTLVLRLSVPSTESLGRLVAGMKPAAVFSLTPLGEPERTLLAERDVPVIDPVTVPGADHDHAIGALQARTLIEHGHTRLAFAHLRDVRQDPFGDGRERGVRDVCREEGLADPVVVRLGIDLDDAATALDALGPPGVAVACYNDDVAMTLLAAARRRGFRVPEDLALIGMDHTPLSAVSDPPLTTITMDLAVAADAATTSLLTRLGRPVDGVPDVSPPRPTVVAGGTV